MLALDPGLHAFGWARGSHVVGLESCGLATAPKAVKDLNALIVRLSAQMPSGPPGVVLLEQMTMRQNDERSQPEDLLRVQLVGASVAGILASPHAPEFVTPMTWKGCVPKEIHHGRIVRRLDETERAVLERDLVGVPKGLRHNVMDAVGILLYGLGRKA